MFVCMRACTYTYHLSRKHKYCVVDLRAISCALQCHDIQAHLDDHHVHNAQFQSLNQMMIPVVVLEESVEHLVIYLSLIHI